MVTYFETYKHVQIEKYVNVYQHVYVHVQCFFVLSGPDMWWTKPEKRKVRREHGGMAILTCKSFDVLGARGERQTEPSHK